MGGKQRTLLIRKRPLFDEAGAVVGIIGQAHDITERKHDADILRITAEGVSGSVGETFFPWLVKHLASTSETAFAFIGELVGTSMDRIRTIAVQAHGVAAENFEYELRGTPCEFVVSRASAVYERDVQRKFPEDTLLAEMEVDSYVGLPLFDSARKPLGNLVILDTKPIEQVHEVLSHLQIFAARAAAEIERKRVVEALRKNEDRHSEAQRIAQVGHWEWDLKSSTVWRSDQYARILGRAKDDTFGDFATAIRHLVHPDDQARVLERREKLIAGGEPYDIEFRVLRPDGTLRHVRSLARVERGADGEPVRHYGVTQDITERKTMEEALRESEARHREAQRLAHIGHWEWDMETSTGRFSEEFSRIIGYPPDVTFEDFSQAVSTVVHADDKAFVIRAREGLVDHGKPYDIEFRIVRPDGTIRHVHSLAEMVRDAVGAPARVIGTTQDITERKQMEEALEVARDEAELASRAKTEFLANMSHELRTPLNSIIGFSEVLVSEMLGPLGQPRYREYAQDINDSGTQLLALIKDILDVSQIEMGRLELQEEKIDVPLLADSCRRLVGERAARGGVDVSLEVADGLPLFFADDLRVKQIVLNLLTNAVKFTPEGGRVTLFVSVDGAGEFRFVISDTGIGIDPGDIDRVMSMFEQADGALARRYEGAGLGLPLTKRLVEMHGGTLDLDSTPDAGTTVTVRFPATRVVA